MYSDYKKYELISLLKKQSASDDDSNYLLIEQKFKNGEIMVKGTMVMGGMTMGGSMPNHHLELHVLDRQTQKTVTTGMVSIAICCSSPVRRRGGGGVGAILEGYCATVGSVWKENVPPKLLP